MAKRHLIEPTKTLNDMPVSEIEQVFSQLLGTSVISVERMYGGRNNRLYRLTCSGSERYVAKLYPEPEPNGRDRLSAEFDGFNFLCEQGLICVPKPVAADISRGYSIYEHIDGQIIPAATISESDIDQAAGCLVKIKDCRSADGSTKLSTAAEACFSVQDVFHNIDGRLARLLTVDEDGDQYLELRSFLDEKFSPALVELKSWSETKLQSWGISPRRELELSERTLSPSDFGFHNALKRPTGEIVFLDFEYFGWDDPAKMISDFLLHPAMELKSPLKKRFVSSVLSGFHEYKNLGKRLAVAYPIFGLKWCLIILNEFLPEKLARREFANGAPDNLTEVRANQLAKASSMLDRILGEYAEMPYGL